MGITGEKKVVFHLLLSRWLSMEEPQGKMYLIYQSRTWRGCLHAREYSRPGRIIQGFFARLRAREDSTHLRRDIP